jgi:hypothetical protein
MPKLPTDGIFSIDQMLRKGSFTQTEAVMWQWRDDRSIWHHYTAIDSKIVEVGLCGLMDFRVFFKRNMEAIINTEISLHNSMFKKYICIFLENFFFKLMRGF